MRQVVVTSKTSTLAVKPGRTTATTSALHALVGEADDLVSSGRAQAEVLTLGLLRLLLLLVFLILILILLTRLEQGVRCQAVLRGVEASVLDLLRHAHADDQVDEHEKDAGGARGPADDGERAADLHGHLLAVGARSVHVGVGRVLDVAVGAEEADSPQAPAAARAVDDAGVAGVVDLEVKERVVAGVEDEGADDADEARHPRLNNRAVGRD
eukprot:2480965-Rhodomonas_salina.1